MSSGIGPQKFQRGKPLKAETLGRNNRGVMRGINPGPGATQRTMGDRVLNDPNARAQFQTPQCAMFRVAQLVEVYDDYLVCQMYSPVQGDVRSADTVNVAKEYNLRRTPFDGFTIAYLDGSNITYTYDAVTPEIKREHDDGVDAADYLVTPTWFIGEEIVIIPIENGVDIGDGVYLHWMELPGQRHWAEVP